MIVKGRGYAVLVLCILWLVTAAAAYVVSVTYGLSLPWLIVLISFLFMLLGLLIVVCGWVRCFFPFCFYTKEDLPEYNTKKISLTMGAVYVIISCAILFIDMSGLMLWPFLAVAVVGECAPIYLFVSKKYKADPTQY